ncbi:TetR family transcriptional regulator [Rhodobacterales bacterium HKCCE2091]|nr:TetR family transcriptional regulator [Rhodobacterales bacterium HKCCE2091]
MAMTAERLTKDNLTRKGRATRDRLLIAARRLYATAGPGAVTPAAVARSAGLPRATAYTYFADGAEMVAEIEAETARILSREIERAGRHEAPGAGRAERYLGALADLPLNDAGRAPLAVAGLRAGGALEAALLANLRVDLKAAGVEQAEQAARVVTSLVTGLVDGQVRGVVRAGSMVRVGKVVLRAVGVG